MPHRANFLPTHHAAEYLLNDRLLRRRPLRLRRITMNIIPPLDSFPSNRTGLPSPGCWPSVEIYVFDEDARGSAAPTGTGKTSKRSGTPFRLFHSTVENGQRPTRRFLLTDDSGVSVDVDCVVDGDFKVACMHHREAKLFSGGASVEVFHCGLNTMFIDAGELTLPKSDLETASKNAKIDDEYAVTLHFDELDDEELRAYYEKRDGHMTSSASVSYDEAAAARSASTVPSASVADVAISGERDNAKSGASVVSPPLWELGYERFQENRKRVDEEGGYGNNEASAEASVPSLDALAETPRLVGGVYGGYVQKVAFGKFGGTYWHRRWIEVKDRQLIYRIDSIKPAKGVYSLRNAQVALITGKFKGKNNCFRLSFDVGVDFELAALTDAERTRWLDILVKASGTGLKRERSRALVDSGQVAAADMELRAASTDPDSEASGSGRAMRSASLPDAVDDDESPASAPLPSLAKSFTDTNVLSVRDTDILGTVSEGDEAVFDHGDGDPLGASRSVKRAAAPSFATSSNAATAGEEATTEVSLE